MTAVRSPTFLVFLCLTVQGCGIFDRSNLITIQNVQSIELISEWEQPRTAAISWAPDSESFAILGENGNRNGITLYDLVSLQPLWFEISENAQDIDFSPDGEAIAVAIHALQLGILDSVTGEEIERLYDSSICNIGHQLRFHPGGDSIVMGSAAGRGTEFSMSVSLWDLEENNCLIEGFVGEGWLVMFDINKDGDKAALSLTRIYSEDEFTQVRIVDIENGSEICRLEGYGAIFHPLEGIFVAGDESGQLRFWNADDCTQSGEISATGSALGFSPNGQLLAVEFEGGIIFIESSSGALLHRLDGISFNSSILEFSPDGQFILIATGGTTVHHPIISLWGIK